LCLLSYCDVTDRIRWRRPLITNERSAAIEQLALEIDGLRDRRELQGALQRFCELFYAAFPDTALIRVFGTVPMGRLGSREREFVHDLIARESRGFELFEGDPILTLFGTRGIEPEWCDRKASRDHLAIPLSSEEFIAEIPMLSRLLSELGFTSIRARNGTWQFVSRLDASGDGLFFVGDARTATDERGRLIIPASDFVDRYGIRSVFGFGGEVATQSMMLAVIVFARTVLSREDAACFVPLFDRLRSATESMLQRQALFEANP
jgi:hypothetical protein